MRLLKSLLPIIRLFVATVVVGGLTFGCASNTPHINMQEEHDFTTINTYYIQPPLNSSNATIERHVSSTIDTILRSKGLAAANQEEADIIVGFFPTSATKENDQSISFGLGTGVFGRSSAISLGSVFSVPVGEQVSLYQNLQIDIAQDGTYIYSAAGNAELEYKDSVSIQNKLTNLVHELLEAYPAKSEDAMEP
ncbi:DUF4136 domain-containing protein [Alteromonas sp. ASW11-130]|uniref:DUF4136 domain-containing protein n=1 Tax=Alteromonas sp. ASW11-130 TaxID=3015775 RepID=UPI0022421BB5|nr:DUF4136 domain-containing protein [Alteromonas sp. ASW11-130]MCW8093092.1 DUF4136 domain-containing protein [Alteromonas sp. ASW11-130]